MESILLQVFLVLLGSIITGTITGVVTVATIKNDVGWLKDHYKSLCTRVWHLEQRKECNHV